MGQPKTRLHKKVRKEKAENMEQIRDLSSFTAYKMETMPEKQDCIPCCYYPALSKSTKIL